MQQAITPPLQFPDMTNYASRLSYGPALAAVRRSTCSSERVICTAAKFSTSWSTVRAPIIGAVTGSRCQSQAIAVWAGVPPTSAATDSRTSATSKFSYDKYPSRKLLDFAARDSPLDPPSRIYFRVRNPCSRGLHGHTANSRSAAISR
jgi:hypothetical protein